MVKSGPILKLTLKLPNKNKNLFISRNRFEALSQTESIEVDTSTSNLTPVILNNSEVHTQ